MKNDKMIFLGILFTFTNLAWADLRILPEYGYPECQRCYTQQQWCYEFETRNTCTDDILECVRAQCTHYKQQDDKWYAF